MAEGVTTTFCIFYCIISTTTVLSVFLNRIFVVSPTFSIPSINPEYLGILRRIVLFSGFPPGKKETDIIPCVQFPGHRFQFFTDQTQNGLVSRNNKWAGIHLLSPRFPFRCISPVVPGFNNCLPFSPLTSTLPCNKVVYIPGSPS